MHGLSPHLAMLILLALFFLAHYVFASVDAYTTALLPVILLTGAAIPGIPVKEFGPAPVHGTGDHGRHHTVC